jgi:branched-chain amino acid transport system substrate-binding protein
MMNVNGTAISPSSSLLRALAAWRRQKALLVGLALAALSPASFSAGPNDPLVIGQTYVGSGPLAGLSTEPVLGIRAMFDSVNANGGVLGRRIEIRHADDGFDGERAAENVRKFAQSGVLAVIMPIGHSSSVGALKAANENKIPLVAPYSGAAAVVKFSEYGFPLRIGYEEEYERIVAHLFTLGINRIVFAYADTPGARAAMEVTRRSIELRGHKLLGSVVVKQDGSDALDKARELSVLKAQTVVLSLANSVAAPFIQGYRASGGAASFYSFSFLDGPSLYKAIGTDAADVVVSQVVPYPWGKSLPLIADYRNAMQKAGAKNLSYGSLEGYIAAKTLVEALKRAGPNPTPTTVKRALESFGSLDLGGLQIRYGPGEHAGLMYSELTLIRRDGGYAR